MLIHKYPDYIQLRYINIYVAYHLALNMRGWNNDCLSFFKKSMSNDLPDFGSPKIEILKFLLLGCAIC